MAFLLLLSSSFLWLIGGYAGGPRVGGSFALVDGDGRTVTDQSFRGKYMLIYFGYVSCADVCPMTLANLAKAFETLGDIARQVQPVFITVDPARDTPEIVQRYARSFLPQLIGLSGTPAELRRVESEYRIVSVVHHGAGGAYTVDHSSVLYMIGRDGRYVAALRADGSAEELARAISRLLS